MNTKGFVKGAMVLVIFNLIGKVLGAIYRIPLANILGPVGIGKYQLVFPLYSLLLSISVSGIPVAISKMVAEYNGKGQFADIKKLLKLSKVYLCLISLFAVSLIVVFSKFIAKIQGNPEIYLCYYAIAPAVLFVGILSVYRGYFQGNLNMMPTAISNIIEQIGKLIFGLYFASLLSEKGVEYGVFGALLGISISELLALVFLGLCYLFSKTKKVSHASLLSGMEISKQLIRTAIPISIGGLMGPVTALIDSVLVVNLLIHSGFSSQQSTMLLGLQSGVVDPIINIPIVIAVSISASLLPSVAKAYAQKEKKEIKVLIAKAMQITLSVSLICSICFVIFGKQILTFLYGASLDESQVLVSVKLLFLGGVNLLFLSLVQVSSGVLQGLGKQSFTVKSLLIGSIIKVGLTVILVSVNYINILGAMISGGVSYIVVFILNYKQITNETGVRITNIVYDIIVQSCFVSLFAYYSNKLFDMAFGKNIALFAGGIVSMIIFLVTYYTFFLSDKRQIISS